METSDFLVIGSGLAGLTFALEVAELGTVTVLAKDKPEEGSTIYAQGGIASVISPLDSFESHINDTLNAGAGLCKRDIVEMVITEGPECIKFLLDLGVRFDRYPQTGGFSLGREGGHSVRRVLHAKDATGAEIHRAVRAQVAKCPSIKILEHHIAIDLITSREGNSKPTVRGAYVLDKNTGEIKAFSSRATMLATGGLGKVYLYTSNPDVSTGDGVAMAYRAGARIANMEFIQFHPTCLYHPKAKSFLITEAMRGEGAKLKLLSGKEFMHRYHEMAELAPRDVVARAIDEQMKKSGDDHVLLDMTSREPDFIRSRFPTIYRQAKAFGIDISTEPIPVVPAAHYCCGGVLCDDNALTDLANFYVAGEVACTGLHGANRLASNSLLEALVFAHRAALHLRGRFSELESPSPVPEWDYVGSVESPEEVIVAHNWDELRRLMWNLVGIVRSNKRLSLAKRRVSRIKEEIDEYYWTFMVTSDLVELRNITQVAELIIDSAMLRHESRGLHFSLDYPATGGEEAPLDTVLER